MANPTYTPSELAPEVIKVGDKLHTALDEIAEDNDIFDDISESIQTDTGQVEPYEKNELASEINRINTNIANAYDEAEAKGATMPQTQNSANLADTIASISGGGIPIDEGSQTPLYFGVHAGGFVLSSNPADETPVAFGVNANGHPYVKGGTT